MKTASATNITLTDTGWSGNQHLCWHPRFPVSRNWPLFQSGLPGPGRARGCIRYQLLQKEPEAILRLGKGTVPWAISPNSRARFYQDALGQGQAVKVIHSEH